MYGGILLKSLRVSDVKQKYRAQDYDVIVVGAGHAGCEAALAAAVWEIKPFC